MPTSSKWFKEHEYVLIERCWKICLHKLIYIYTHIYMIHVCVHTCMYRYLLFIGVGFGICMREPPAVHPS